MGKDWERKQREKLVQKQKDKIAELQHEVATAQPLPPKPEPPQNTDNL